MNTFIDLLFNSQSNNAINKILDNIDYKLSIFTKDDQFLIKQLFKINFSKIAKTTIFENEDNQDLNDGIERFKAPNDNEIKEEKEFESREEKETEIKEENINYFNEIIKKFIPLICLITVSNEDLTTFNEIIDYINENEYLKSIIEETINTWCNKKNKDALLLFNRLYDSYFKFDKKFNLIILEIKEIFKLNLYNKNELSKSIDKYLVPHINEKKQNAEVSTPSVLRKEMIDIIPSDFWKTPKKVFEPCSGKGGFLIDIIDKFMNGLKEVIEDDEERYKTIVEECLYYSDINKQNIFIAKLLLDPFNKYNLNANEGDTLKINIKEKWMIEGFDLVIGNPPYNDASGNKGRGHCIWTAFVEKTLNEWLNIDAYLVYIHPSLWRQFNHPLQKLIKEKQLIYLEIHNIDDGLKIFNCSTRYDWYLLQNKEYYKNTIIKCEDGKIENENLLEWQYIPNMMYEELKTISNSDIKLDVWRYRSLYSTENKKLVSKIKNEVYKYPLIYTINKNNIASLRYTNNNTLGHFEKSKFIFSNGAGFICDYNGDYGLTEWSYCIYDDKENLEKIDKTFRSLKFNKIKKAIQIDSSTYNIKIMKYFNKDFYKEFII